MPDPAQWSFVSSGADAMRAYEGVLVPRLFEPWARVLLDHIAVAPGEAVLDVACGPGSVTRLAAARVGASGRVTGCDISPVMLAAARGRRPLLDSSPVEYLQCGADALDVATGSFDVATCQHGLQFFPDRHAALAEMRRALRPGGRLGLAVWAPIEESPLFAALASALARAVDEEAAAAYRSGPWALDDADAVTALVAAAGFTDVRLTRHQLPVVFEGGPVQVAGVVAVGPVGPRLDAAGEDGRRRFLAAVEEDLSGMLDDGEARSVTTAYLVTATA